MQPAFSIDPGTGAVSIEGVAIPLHSGASRKDVAAALSPFWQSNLDHKNGYEWLNFEGLSFGGKPACVSICFWNGKLTQLHWGISLRENLADKSWPTQEEDDQQVAFVREVLRTTLSRSFSSGEERFPWGAVWSVYDPRSGGVSSGLRYMDKPRSNTWIVFGAVFLILAFFGPILSFQLMSPRVQELIGLSSFSLPFFGLAIAQLRSGYLWRNMTPGNRGRHRSEAPGRFFVSITLHLILALSIFAYAIWIFAHPE